jgi:hypothetical protein
VVAGWCGLALASEPLPLPQGPVLLTVAGAIQETNAPGEARFDRAMLERLGHDKVRTTTPWTDGVKTFDGIKLKTVLDRVGARGVQVKASALNDFTSTIPFEDLRYEPVLAMAMDGRVLTRRDRGPLWLVYPRDTYDVLMDSRFEDRWVWQTNRLDVQ